MASRRKGVSTRAILVLLLGVLIVDLLVWKSPLIACQAPPGQPISMEGEGLKDVWAGKSPTSGAAAAAAAATGAHFNAEKMCWEVSEFFFQFQICASLVFTTMSWGQSTLFVSDRCFSR